MYPLSAGGLWDAVTTTPAAASSPVIDHASTGVGCVPGWSIARIPIVLVVTFRLEFEPPWSGHGQVTVITLNRLSRRETADMVLKVTGGKTLPDELVNQIVQKTDGVPPFVEELTKTVIESDPLDDAGDGFVFCFLDGKTFQDQG